MFINKYKDKKIVTYLFRNLKNIFDFKMCYIFFGFEIMQLTSPTFRYVIKSKNSHVIQEKSENNN